VSRLPKTLLTPARQVGRAAGVLVVRDLFRRVEAVAEAAAENAPLDRAAEQQIARLEAALVPLLEGDAASRDR